MAKSWAALAVSVALAMAAPTARADQRASDAIPDPLVIGVEDIVYLPAYTVEDGAYVGYARDVLDAFAADMGVTVAYRPMPVLRLYASLAAGQVAFKFPDNPNWNPDFRTHHDITYSNPVAQILDASVVLADRADITPDQVVTLGTVTGFAPFPWLDRINAGTVTLLENPDFASLVRQVIAGRVDAAYASIAVVNRIQNQTIARPGALVFAPNLPHDFGGYSLSTIDHPDVIARFNAWLDENSDRVEALKQASGVERGIAEAKGR